MPTIFIVNNSGHDFSQAERQGRVVVLSTGLIDPFKVTKMYRQFSSMLSTSRAEDYILMSGPTTMNIIACAIFSALHGRINLLIWRHGHYTKRTIVLREAGR